LRGRIDELSRQLNNANDELRELRTTFGQVTSYNELLVRENAELKRKLKGKGKDKGKGRARDDDDEPEDENAGDSRQIKRQRRVAHSSEEDEEVGDERARVSLLNFIKLTNSNRILI
jgi:regulator of replication initiation timing